MFLEFAPFAKVIIALFATVRSPVIWNTHEAHGSPPPSNLRPVVIKSPVLHLYTPGAKVWLLRFPANSSVSLLRQRGGLFTPISGGHFDRFFQSYIIIAKIGGLRFFLKLKTSIQNVKGYFMFAFERELQVKGKIVCEGCFNKNKADASFIGFIIFQDQTIMRPRGFFIGHKKCVEHEIKTCENQFWDTKISIRIEELNNFFTNDFNDIKKISEKDKQEKKSIDSEFEQVVTRLKLIDERIYKR